MIAIVTKCLDTGTGSHLLQVHSPFYFFIFFKTGSWNNVYEAIFVSSGKLGQLICVIVLLCSYFGNRIADTWRYKQVSCGNIYFLQK